MSFRRFFPHPIEQPMPEQPATCDLELLERAGVAPYECACGYNNERRLVLVDRYITDFPPIPRKTKQMFWEVYRADGMDPDDILRECPNCGCEWPDMWPPLPPPG